MTKALLKSSKTAEMHPRPKKCPEYSQNLKITKIPPKPIIFGNFRSLGLFLVISEVLGVFGHFTSLGRILVIL